MGSMYSISLQQEKRNSLPVLPSHMGPQTMEPIHHVYRMLKDSFTSANRGFLAQFCSLPLQSLKFTIRVLESRNKTIALLS